MSIGRARNQQTTTKKTHQICGRIPSFCIYKYIFVSCECVCNGVCRELHSKSLYYLNESDLVQITWLILRLRSRLSCIANGR